jgi:hypothetical protein
MCLLVSICDHSTTILRQASKVPPKSIHGAHQHTTPINLFSPKSHSQPSQQWPSVKPPTSTTRRIGTPPRVCWKPDIGPNNQLIATPRPRKHQHLSWEPPAAQARCQAEPGHPGREVGGLSIHSASPTVPYSRQVPHQCGESPDSKCHSTSTAPRARPTLAWACGTTRTSSAVVPTTPRLSSPSP